MNYNNKDLYQIIKIDKNASQELVNQKCQELVKKDTPEEIGIAALVLSNPQKRAEYDRVGWKEEWRKEWEKHDAFRHSIFRVITDHKNFLIDQDYKTPDGFKVYVFIHEDLDPNLWAPYKDRLGGWIDKIFGIFDTRGDNENWKQELEDYKNKMITALNQAYEENKKTPINKGFWEKAEGETCSQCEKPAQLRRKESSKAFCSLECYDNSWRVDYEKFPKRENPKIPPRDNQTPNKNELDKYKCSNCWKKIEWDSYGAKDSDGNEYHYCSKICLEKHTNKPNNVSSVIKKLEEFLKKKNSHQEEITQVEYNRLTGKKTTKKVKWNPLHELLKWMKKEGITNISLNSEGKLVLGHGNLNKIIEDNNLSVEQKEIKEFFQQSGQTYFNQGELEEVVNKEVSQKNKGKDKNDNKWIMPVTIIGMGAVILILIGVVIHKNKKRGY